MSSVHGVLTGQEGREPGAPRGLKMMLAQYERELILKALHEAAGNQRRAAFLLGLLPSTLNEKMKRLRLQRRRAATRPDLSEEASLSVVG